MLKLLWTSNLYFGAWAANKLKAEKQRWIVSFLQASSAFPADDRQKSEDATNKDVYNLYIIEFRFFSCLKLYIPELRYICEPEIPTILHDLL